MKATKRNTAFALLFLLLAGGVLLSATRFAASGTARETADVAIPRPHDADSAPPDIAADADELNRAGHFSGRVTDPEGKSVRGARVFIVPNSGFRNAGLSEGGTLLLNPLKTIGPVRAVTDADGHFAFDAADMTYTAVDGFVVRRQGLMLATAEGLAPDWMTTFGDNSHQGSHWDPVKGASLDLQLGTNDVPIHGRFLSPDGQLLMGARVQLTRLMIPRNRDLDAYLKKETADYSIFIPTDYERELDQPDLIPRLTTETRTDAEGQFTLSGIGRDRLAMLTVSAPNVDTTTLTVMTRDAPNVGVGAINGQATNTIYGAGFTLKLEPGRTIKGRVIDRASGEPIPGMWVGPLQNYRAGVSSDLYPWVTDEEGRFTITGLPISLTPEVLAAIAPPGVPYQSAGEWIVGNKEVLIRCPRGIPFRLSVFDEQGKPVDAEVTYVDVPPNPHVERLIPRPEERYHWPNAPAARISEGIYRGFALPGPGAVLVKTPRSAGYRPAHVDPKTFFAPGRTEWTQSQEWAYGTDDTLTTSNEAGQLDQNDYSAIILVNPPPALGSLELSATVTKDRPRRVNLIDPDGQPVEVEIYARRARRRAASFLLTELHPDRVRPLTYIQKDRQLIGFLLARADGETPYTVRMQPWGTVTGRIIDENGEALSGATISVSQPVSGRHIGDKTDEEGRFQIEKLVPGHSYSAKVHRGTHSVQGHLVLLFAGIAFENLVLRPGELCDLGDVPTKPPVYEDFPLIYENYEESGTESAN